MPRKTLVRNVLCRGSAYQEGCSCAGTAGLGQPFCLVFPLQAQTAALASLEHIDRNTDGTWTTHLSCRTLLKDGCVVVEVQTAFQQEHPSLPWEREQSQR